MVGAHHTVARVHGRALDDGQDIALHAFARNVRTVPTFAARDLIDFVKKHDSCILHAIDCHACHLVHVDQALFFFLNQILKGLVDLHLPFLGSLSEDAGQHVLEIDVHLFDALVGQDFE